MASTAKRLTPRQFSVYKFIKEEIAAKGVPPTRMEIARKFNLSSASAAKSHIDALEKKGLISVTPKIARGIKLSAVERGGSPRTAGDSNSARMSADWRKGTLEIAADEKYRVPDSALKHLGIRAGDMIAVECVKDFPDGKALVLFERGEERILRLYSPGDGAGELSTGGDDGERMKLTQTDKRCLVGIARYLVRRI